MGDWETGRLVFNDLVSSYVLPGKKSLFQTNKIMYYQMFNNRDSMVSDGLCKLLGFEKVHNAKKLLKYNIL